MALKKGGLKPNEAIVIENAPLGSGSRSSSGHLYRCSQYGSALDASVLLNSGAHLLFHPWKAYTMRGRSVQRFTSHTVIKKEVFT